MHHNDIKEAMEQALDDGVTFEWLLAVLNDALSRTQRINRINGNLKLARKQHVLQKAVELAQVLAQNAE